MAWVWLILAGLLEVVWATGSIYLAILGMVLFNEPRELARIGSILLIVAGIAGLKLVTQ
jgi:quaternary ammonium compound-resistance protein SugE